MRIDSTTVSASRKCQFFVKRVIDIVIALTGLVLLLPLFILIAAAIKLTSKGPVFFLQNRVGKDATIFKLVKFRTMVPGAVNMGAGLSVTPADPRITRIGSILRKTSLDETPQLLNVLKGDISLIGPRPTVPEHLAYYGDFEYRRLEVKPGITGLAMVRCRSSMPWSVRIKYDVEYIDKFNLWLDCKILAETLWVVLARKNIYYDYEKHGLAFDLVKPLEKSDAGKQENAKDINQAGARMGEDKRVLIRGERIQLRTTAREDMKLKVKWFNNPEVNRTLILPEMLELEKTYEWFEKTKGDQTRVDFIIETREGKPIGVVGLKQINLRNKSAGCYIVIGEKEFWGKGLGLEAELLIIHYAFKNYNLHKMCGSSIEYNTASLAVIKKVGFHRDGVLRDEYFKDGKFYDVHIFSILREEFYKAHQEYKDV